MSVRIDADLKFPLDVMSDIHLEFTNVQTIQDMEKKGFITIPKDAIERTLVLAGDIGHPYDEQYWSFLFSCCDIYDRVLCVAGNHEYYSKPSRQIFFDEITDTMKMKRNERTNLHIFLDEIIEFNNVTVVGGTLWTNIPISKAHIIHSMMNDYNLIYKNHNTCLDIDDTKTMHQKSKSIIKQCIEKSEKKIIVITHHLCSSELIHPQYKGSPINIAFYTDLSDIMNENILVWICGHTHRKMIKNVRYKDDLNCKVIINPMGYPGENTHHGIESFYDV